MSVRQCPLARLHVKSKVFVSTGTNFDLEFTIGIESRRNPLRGDGLLALRARWLIRIDFYCVTGREDPYLIRSRLCALVCRDLEFASGDHASGHGAGIGARVKLDGSTIQRLTVEKDLASKRHATVAGTATTDH